MPSLDTVPDEIIEHILYYVSPNDNLATVQLLSQRYCRLANAPLLWRFHCQTSFRYWSPEHRFEEKLAGLASDVDWKAIWMTRRRRNSRVGHLLDGILATQLGRLRKFEQICILGYDAKDFLLEQCRADESAEDVLARRYYGKKALDSIHRSVAVQLWSTFQSNPAGLELDRALGAFDMFALHEGDADVDEIYQQLDTLTSHFLRDEPTFRDKTTRDKALAIVRWLRANRLTGINDVETNYSNLRNCLLGQALFGDEHPSLPIISTTIFCSVARRLGLCAFCGNFPAHVRAVVTAPEGRTLDDKPRAADGPSSAVQMFLDPFGRDDEVSWEELVSAIRELRRFGMHGPTDPGSMMAQSKDMVQRNAYNLLHVHRLVQEAAERDDVEARDRLMRLRHGDPKDNMDLLFYAAEYAAVLTAPFTSPMFREALNSFLSHFVRSYPEDSWIVEKYLAPLDRAARSAEAGVPIRPRDGLMAVETALGITRNLDRRAPTCHRRYAMEIHADVLYKIGHVFRHRRYGFVGVICSWDVLGSRLRRMALAGLNESSDDGQGASSQENSDAVGSDMPRRRRVYYTCIREYHASPAVIYQPNIEIITDARLVTARLIQVAGKCFKRFDRDSCTFVSNITEVFPDD